MALVKYDKTKRGWRCSCTRVWGEGRNRQEAFQAWKQASADVLREDQRIKKLEGEFVGLRNQAHVELVQETLPDIIRTATDTHTAETLRELPSKEGLAAPSPEDVQQAIETDTAVKIETNPEPKKLQNASIAGKCLPVDTRLLVDPVFDKLTAQHQDKTGYANSLSETAE